MANSQFITLAVLVCVLGVGIMLGRFAKPTGLNKLRYQLHLSKKQWTYPAIRRAVAPIRICLASRPDY